MKGEFYNRIKIEYEHQQLVAFILCTSEDEATKLGEFSKQTCEISSLESYRLNEGTDYKYQVKWYSSDALDLIINLNEHTELYNNILASIPPYSLQFKFKKTNSNAVTPMRAHGSDSGFDLTLINKTKTVGDVDFYTTGIQVEPPHGYYFDLVPRSSITKMGYMLANSVGIIDQNYRGDIIVALRKIDMNAKNIELPVKLVQLIPRQWIHMSPVETESLDITLRGEEGFGSTGK
jgi:deoxyuridine 5'-triphosphate nucleotidohydrolase